MAFTTTSTTAAPTVILNDDTAPSTEASETEAKFNAIVGYTPIDYPALTDLEVLDGLVNGPTETVKNRHWAEFMKRVKPTVEATARKLMADNPNDRDDAVNYAIAKVMDLEEHAKVVNAVRRGEKLANCIAAFVRGDSTKAVVNKGRHLNAAGGKNTKTAPKEDRKLITVDFTADETLRAIDGNTYTMDPLDDALDSELFGVPTEVDEVIAWFQNTLRTHGAPTTQRELDALLHSTALTREAVAYLDDLAVTNRAEAARAIGAAEPTPRNSAKRIGPARLPHIHVAEIMGTSRRTTTRDIDNAENDIYGNPVMLRELRQGVNGTRRVIPEDIANELIGWLIEHYAQANITPTETAVRTIPDTQWHNAMANFGYNAADYTTDDIDDLIEAVIAGVTA